jgi:hypothetical protein
VAVEKKAFYLFRKIMLSVLTVQIRIRCYIFYGRKNMISIFDHQIDLNDFKKIYKNLLFNGFRRQSLMINCYNFNYDS